MHDCAYCKDRWWLLHICTSFNLQGIILSDSLRDKICIRNLSTFLNSRLPLFLLVPNSPVILVTLLFQLGDYDCNGFFGMYMWNICIKHNTEYGLLIDSFNSECANDYNASTVEKQGTVASFKSVGLLPVLKIVDFRNICIC